jgi:trans-2,3-dihydro-3-hydroxyanthranilate isomerase
MASEVKGGILIFCSQTIHGGTEVHVRVFVDLFGIPEDPATGSGNGCLAGYLSHYRYFGTDEVDVTVE